MSILRHLGNIFKVVLESRVNGGVMLRDGSPFVKVTGLIPLNASRRVQEQDVKTLTCSVIVSSSLSVKCSARCLKGG